MDTRLKQRLIGAIVLTALAIIIVPMLLDGTAQDRARIVARIPEPPGIRLTKITVADIDHRMTQMEAASAAKVPHLAESVPQSQKSAASVNAASGQGAAPTASANSHPTKTTPDAAAPANGEPAKTDTGATKPGTPTVVPQQVATSAKDDAGLALDKNGLPVGWCLQLASFRDHQNALNLRKKLRDAHYRAYVIAARTDQGTVYRVLVGPMLQKAKLAQFGKQIESSFNLKGEIVRYRIEADAGQLGG